MSQENVERLRRSYQAFNVTQKTDLDLWATDIEYIQTADVGAGETVQFEELNIEPERFFDLGNRVLAFVRLRGRARRGGVPIDAPFAHLATLREVKSLTGMPTLAGKKASEPWSCGNKAMSAENVEILRAGFDAFNRGDYDSWVGAFAEDVEVHDLADTPDTGVFHGHAGVREWLAKLQVAFGDGFRFEPTSFRESRGVVVADVRASATGVGGGVPIEMSVYIVFRMRDGKIVWTQGFLDRDGALEVVRRLREAGAGRRRGFGWLPSSVSGPGRRSSRRG